MEIRDRGRELSTPGVTGARPRCGSAGMLFASPKTAGMLFASPKAANSSAAWALVPPPGMRGSLIPADTEVTGQAPNRPAEPGEMAFAVTRICPRHRCHAGRDGTARAGAPTPHGAGVRVVPGCQAGCWEGMQPAGTGEKRSGSAFSQRPGNKKVKVSYEHRCALISLSLPCLCVSLLC